MMSPEQVAEKFFFCYSAEGSIGVLQVWANEIFFEHIIKQSLIVNDIFCLKIWTSSWIDCEKWKLKKTFPSYLNTELWMSSGFVCSVWWLLNLDVTSAFLLLLQLHVCLHHCASHQRVDKVTFKMCPSYYSFSLERRHHCDGIHIKNDSYPLNYHVFCFRPQRLMVSSLHRNDKCLKIPFYVIIFYMCFKCYWYPSENCDYFLSQNCIFLNFVYIILYTYL